jgi:putative transposase
VVRYSFPVGLFHSLLHAGLSRRTDSLPCTGVISFRRDGADRPSAKKVEIFAALTPLYIRMPRQARCVVPGVACHITQRGVDRGNVFFTAKDRLHYLQLLKNELLDGGVRILSYCLMSNHVHLVVVPERAESLAITFRRTHGRYAQYLNIRRNRTGHLWQNRFYSTMLSASHLWVAIGYAERNPVRARMVERPDDHRWSSARAHLTGVDESGVLDMEFWRREGGSERWCCLLADQDELAAMRALEASTFSGRPFGEDEFVEGMASRFQRQWRVVRTLGVAAVEANW